MFSLNILNFGKDYKQNNNFISVLNKNNNYTVVTPGIPVFEKP